MTPALHIRPARAEDASQAVPLVLLSARELLSGIFIQDGGPSVSEFLTAAWQRGPGQYGYQNHWVACRQTQVVGVVTCWHNQLPEGFDQQTLIAISDCFGLPETVAIVQRSELLTLGIERPGSSELALGHLAVAQEAQRQGVGRALVNFMQEHAKNLGKRRLTLDVEYDNLPAQAFYLAQGFTSGSASGAFIRYSRTIYT